MKTETIMIVEYNADLRNTLRHAFEDRGYLTWTCLAPEVALSIFNAVQPSIVILDIDMEGPDPMRFIDMWVEQAPETRVIVESRNADIGRMREAMDHGAHAFLVKPFTLDPLFDLLEKEIPRIPPRADAIRKAAA